ncbi:hypothetical protein ACT1U9_32825 (plasmid) [Streptomyces sp. BR1]|uniref:hypothetical protein n=1 Tax=Streptomyces sp. BR1 TaxID=1592323 RepID=UPI00402BD43D
MATITKTTVKTTRPSRLTLRGWMNLRDLVAAACGAWAAIGGWHETHDVTTTATRFAVVYVGVLVVAAISNSKGAK